MEANSMRRFSFRAAALATLATMLVAGAAFAADPSTTTQDPQQRRQQWQQRFQEKLGLTDVQAQQIREIRQRHVQAERQTWTQLREAQKELRRLALSGADDRTLNAKQTEVQTLLTQGMQARLNMLKEIGPILSPEQREAYAQMMDRGFRGHRHHKGPRQQSS
jgi:Spy/CpxP family protein refolding chaperone